jgi:predicted RNase H-like nuclease (RuvC/YqgF family)
MESLSADWRSLYDKADETRGEALQLQQRASEELPQLQEKYGSLIEEVGPLVIRVEKEISSMEKDGEQARNDVSQFEAKCRELEKLKTTADKLKKQLDKKKGKAEQLQGDLETHGETFWLHRKLAAQNLQTGLEQLMADLEDLSKMETSFLAAKDLRRAPALQAKYAKAYEQSRALTEKEHQNLWK